MIQVFVYGTLKPGEANHDRYCRSALALQPAIALGTLFDLPLGYPALTAGDTPVYGCLLTFSDPTILTALDELEDYRSDRPPELNEYLRQKTETFSLDGQPLGTAWVYRMELEQAKHLGGIPLPHGKWSGVKRCGNELGNA